MAVPPQPSARLQRAAAAERQDLSRRRDRLDRRRQTLREELRRVEDQLDAINEQCGLLDRLVPAMGESAPAEVEVAEATLAQELRGPAIREAAVRVLLADERIEALQYREWYRRLLDAGYLIAGKNGGLAAFLTQISRSPVVRRSSQAGVYEIDYEAPARLRLELRTQQERLRELMGDVDGELLAVRQQRNEVNLGISRTERALEEAESLLNGRAAAGDSRSRAGRLRVVQAERVDAGRLARIIQ
jgi:hypothetical protein